mgnify:CR=1 FL=1
MSSNTKAFEDKMKSAVEHLERELKTVRAGRANPGVLDKVTVDYYGSPTPIQQVASVAVSEARTLTITPWDRTLLRAISKAIMASDVGINPIDDGQTISLRGQGHAGKNGGPSGDLLITVMVQPHEIFRREGTSVFCEAPITFTQAVLGAELEIPTIDGKVKYDIPEGTQTGSVFRLRGKGIPSLNGRGRGDQYVTVNIETPKNLNKEQKEALKKFSDLLGESNYEKRKSFFKKH